MAQELKSPYQKKKPGAALKEHLKSILRAQQFNFNFTAETNHVNLL